MNSLDSLLRELCPNGVEHKTLGEVFSFRNGYTPSKTNSAFWNGGNIPWFRMEDIRENGRVLKDSLLHVTKAGVKGDLFPKDSLILSTSATIGEYALLRVSGLANQRFTCLVPLPEWKKRILPRFIYHCGPMISAFCVAHVHHGSFPSVDMEQLRDFSIPLPPLPVQEEIVRRLDAMQGVVEALENELALRRKQYEAVREKLFAGMKVAGGG